MAAAEALTIQVTLRCSDKLDEYDTRTLTLRPGSVIHIGRASKNTAKPELMVGPANAYVDSPTISRDHAVLTATSPPSPSVFITDKGSMHGTMVNGNKLEPQKPHRLSNGDLLQFGANVTRENRALNRNPSPFHTDAYPVFYTSRSFSFESSLPSYPKGFSVPDDVETSDEEDLVVDEAMRSPPRYGSETNPVTLDDVDSPRPRGSQRAHPLVIDDDDDDEFSGDELNSRLHDTTLPLDPREDTQDRPSPSEAGDQIFLPEDISPGSFDHRRAFVDDDLSECDDIASGYSSEGDQASLMDGSAIDSCASIVDSDESQSEGDMDLEDDVEEKNEADAPPAPSRLGESCFPRDWPSPQLQLMLLEQQNKKRLLQARAEQDALEARKLGHQSMGSDHIVQNNGHETKSNIELGMTMPLGSYPSAPLDARKEGEPVLYTPNAELAARLEPHKLPEPPEPRMDPFFNPNGIFDDMVFGSMDSSVPPRPAAPRPMQWNMLDYNSPFSPPVATPSFPAPYPSAIVGCHVPTEALLPNPYVSQNPPVSPENVWAQPKCPAEVRASGVQTPPPAPSSEMSSPPVRRTEVSIREIVEDTIQQPPTPTSVTSGLKRKADVLEEPTEEVGGESSPVSAPASAIKSDITTPASPAVDAVDAPATPTNAVDQRPKKRLRSRLGNAAKTAVAWTLPGVFVGAAASVAFLTSVPNDFFMA